MVEISLSQETVEKSVRGKKRCKSCKELVGVRTAKCQCGYEFSSVKAPVETKVVPTPILQLPYSSPISKFKAILGNRQISDFKQPTAYIHTAAGGWEKLTDFSESGIKSWIERVTNSYFSINPRHILSKEAVYSLAQVDNRLYEKTNSEKQKLLMEILDSIAVSV